MNGRVMEEESVFHSYGVSVTGSVGALSFTEEYKKTEVNMSGYYIYQSGVPSPGLLRNTSIDTVYLDRSWSYLQMA